MEDCKRSIAAYKKINQRKLNAYGKSQTDAYGFVRRTSLD